MKTWLVSYADAAFRSAGQRLLESAARWGIDERHLWGRDDLESSSLYRLCPSILDERRGGGYWLWKPFILKETLKAMSPGDVLIYSDAGLEIVADLSPLIDLCRQRAEIMLFAGHYEDVGAPGPNTCGKWTKRDCFVFMDCDEPRYYLAPMADASFVVMGRTGRAAAFVREWLLTCAQPALLTDAPNVGGLPDLPETLGHRHDQSILSLLAARDGLELFRHPSQHGNHVKDAPYREPGERTRHPYGSKGIFTNSPYKTLLHHHRGMIGQTDLRLTLQRTIDAPREAVFAAWTHPDILRKWAPLGHTVTAAAGDVRPGGEFRLDLSGALGRRLELTGTYLEVEVPARLVYRWMWQTRVTVDFREWSGATVVGLEHAGFPSEQAREYLAVGWRTFFETLESELGVRMVRSTSETLS